MCVRCIEGMGGGGGYHLCDIGHEVVGYAVGVLSYATRRMRSYRIEVPEDHNRPRTIGMILLQILGLLEILEDLFNHVFGSTIRIGDTQPSRRIFGDGHSGTAVHRSRR